MREIKFRAWSKEYNEMYDWGGVQYEIYAHLRDIWTDKGFELMQFTGLHDKNGKEIWEGDIVKADYYGIVEVIWKDGSFILKNKLPLIEYQYYVEVIGNIYENRDLLKEIKNEKTNP